MTSNGGVPIPIPWYVSHSALIAVDQVVDGRRRSRDVLSGRWSGLPSIKKGAGTVAPIGGGGGGQAVMSCPVRAG